MNTDRSPYAALFILSLILCLFLYKVLFFGYSLWPTDAIYAMPPWQSAAPPDFRGPSNHLLFDNTFVFYPWFHLASELVRTGSLPLWNSYSACGLPLFANSTGFFFPLNLPFYILPLWYAFGIIAFLKLFFAGFFCYLFLKKIKLPFWSALVGAVSFMLCGFMVGWLGHPQTHVALCLPLLFLLTEHLLNSPGWSSASFLGLAVGLAFLGGHYETTVHVLAPTVLYFPFRLVALRREDGTRNSIRPGLLFAGALLVGIGIAAVQLVPAWEYIRESSLFVARPGSSFRLNFSSDAFIQFFQSLKGLVLNVIPDFYGNPVDRNEWGSAVGMWNYVEQSGYVGVLPFFLAFIAAATRYRDRMVLFFSGLALLSLGIVYRLPLLVDIVSSLPVFSKLNNNRLLLVYSFAMAVLAAYGTNEMSRPETRKRIAVLLGIFAVFSVALAATLWILLFPQYLGNIIGPAIVQYVSKKIWLFLFWALGGLVLLALHLRRRHGQNLVQGLLVAVIAADLLIFATRFWPEIEPDRIYPSTPAIDFLKQDRDLFRIMGGGQVLAMNTAVPFRLPDIRGYDGITLRRYEMFLTGTSGNITFLMGLNSIPRHIDLLNVKYVLLPAGASMPGGRFTKVYEKEITIYRNEHAFPRAFVVPRAVMTGTEREMLRSVYREDFDASREVVVGPDVPADVLHRLQNTPQGGRTRTTVLEHSPARLALEVETQHPGMLVVSNTYYPGWKAFVDGRESPVYRADFMFQSVFLEPGNHRVDLSYEPASFFLGLFITGVSLCLAGIPFLITRSKKTIPRKGR